jgi:SAM-dependent methyltransferase
MLNSLIPVPYQRSGSYGVVIKADPKKNEGTLDLGIEGIVDRFLNFKDDQIIARHIPSGSNGQKVLSCFKRVISRCYEVERRSTDSEYGFVFPINPEVLSYAMGLSKDQTVVELAGARGENGVLLALSGAKKVIINDILPQEIQKCRQIVAELPQQIKDRIDVVEGSCLNLLEKKPELEGRVRFVHCRHLIHFFNDNQLKVLLTMVREMLEVGGYAFFSANNIGGVLYDDLRKTLKDDANDPTCFQVTMAFSEKFNVPVDKKVCHLMVPSSDDKIASKEIVETMAIKSPDRNFAWILNSDWFKNGDPRVANYYFEQVKTYIAKNQKNEIERLVYVSKVGRAYSRKTIQKLFQNHNFQVVQLFDLNENGHLHFEKSNEKLSSIGILVKKIEGSLKATYEK